MRGRWRNTGLAQRCSGYLRPLSLTPTVKPAVSDPPSLSPSPLLLSSSFDSGENATMSRWLRCCVDVAVLMAEPSWCDDDDRDVSTDVCRCGCFFLRLISKPSGPRASTEVFGAEGGCTAAADL